MQCHEIDYELIGDDIQVVEVELDPRETVIAEAGAMNYMEEGIEFEAKMGDGSNPDRGLFGKLLDVGKRALTGESTFMTHFTNNGTGQETRGLRRALSRQDHAVGPRAVRWRDPLPERRFPVRRVGHQAGNRVSKETRCRFLWR